MTEQGVTALEAAFDRLWSAAAGLAPAERDEFVARANEYVRQVLLDLRVRLDKLADADGPSGGGGVSYTLVAKMLDHLILDHTPVGEER